MARARTGIRSPALGLAGFGATALLVGLQASQPIVSPALAPWLSLAGAVCLGTGLVWCAARWRREPEAPHIVPAHVAFMLRTPRPQTVQDEPTPRPNAVERPQSASARHLASLDTEIRDLTRQINKAGVMLATGKLSQDGYTHYVDALKEKRGKLEASRVEFQLRP